jgi:glyoxylase-like metal-dependent hydrolase (beta-lactamase superfamily II)
VYHQPDLSNDKAVFEARQALAACPVAAIRLETLAERRHAATTVEAKQAVENSWTVQDEQLVQKMTARDGLLSSSSSHPSTLFPRPFLDDMDDVFWIGHHNEKSFGAIPYLLRTTTNEYKNNETIWIMIDTPRFGKSAREAVESLTGPAGPDYLFLSHVDDTADHGKWAAHYSNMKRIFNAGDLGQHNWLGDTTLETVEILLQPAAISNGGEDDDTSDDATLLTAYSLNGQPLPHNWMETKRGDDEVVILHTPGHSPGSMTLYRRPCHGKPGILFTGDTYACTTTRNGDRRMTAFPRYGNDLGWQAKTLGKLLDLDWQVIAPGHGHARDYRDNVSSRSSSSSSNIKMQQIREEELRQAQEDLKMYSSRR